MTIDITATFEFKLAEAKSVNEVTFFGTYCDTKSGEDLTPILKRTTSNGTTDVQLMAAPSATYLRTLTDGKFHNADTIAHTVILMTTISASQVVHYRKYIQPNETAVYPKDFTEIQSLKVLSAKTNGGRTVTTQTDTLLITDVNSEILAEYTGTGIQTFTIPKATYTVWDTITIRRLGNQFKVVVEDGAEQTLNSECYSGIVGELITLRYIRDNAGKEQWQMTNGFLGNTLVELINEPIICCAENSNYIVYGYRHVEQGGAYSGNLFLIVDKNLNTSRRINATNLNLRGLRFFELSDSVFTVGNVVANYNSTGIVRTRINTSGILVRDLLTQTYGSYNLNPGCEYTINGVVYCCLYIYGDYLAEYLLNGGTYTSTAKTAAGKYYDTAWDEVDCTGAGTSYLYTIIASTGLRKIDAYDYSTISTQTGIQSGYFINKVPINGYFYIAQGALIIRYKISDGTYSIILTVGYTIHTALYRYTIAYNDLTDIAYLSEVDGYRICVFNLNDESSSTIDVSASLNSHSLYTVSILPSLGKLFFSGWKTSELSQTEVIGGYIDI